MGIAHRSLHGLYIFVRGNEVRALADRPAFHHSHRTKRTQLTFGFRSHGHDDRKANAFGGSDAGLLPMPNAYS